MDIEKLTYGEMKKIAAIFNTAAAQGSISPFVGHDVIVRTYSAGVFYGKLETMAGKEAMVSNARRLWAWAGAASLSQLSKEGTTKPSECKFPNTVDCVHLTEVIEVLPLTEKAKESLDGVKIWSA